VEKVPGRCWQRGPTLITVILIKPGWLQTHILMIPFLPEGFGEFIRTAKRRIVGARLNLVKKIRDFPDISGLAL